jgi:mannose-6-phosphate isomerase-like protein (cupin superfamily)
MKRGYKENIEKLTLENKDFRRVLYTAENLQLVLMNLKPGQDIGVETHPDNDQFFRFEAGEGRVFVDGTSYEVGDGDTVIVPKGSEHNVLNMSNKKDLKFYTIYAGPHHKDGIVRETKEEAMRDEEEFDGVTTE